MCWQGPSSSPARRASGSNNNSSAAKATPSRKTPSPALKGVDPKLAQIILDEILEGGASVQWEDIAGQEVQLTRLTNKVIMCTVHIPADLTVFSLYSCQRKFHSLQFFCMTNSSTAMEYNIYIILCPMSQLNKNLILRFFDGMTHCLKPLFCTLPIVQGPGSLILPHFRNGFCFCVQINRIL